MSDHELRILRTIREHVGFALRDTHDASTRDPLLTATTVELADAANKLDGLLDPAFPYGRPPVHQVDPATLNLRRPLVPNGSGQTIATRPVTAMSCRPPVADAATDDDDDGGGTGFSPNGRNGDGSHVPMDSDGELYANGLAGDWDPDRRGA